MDGEAPEPTPRRDSLERWSERRDRRRATDHWITGTRRALPLIPGGGGSHLRPDQPRLLLERAEDGRWSPVGVAVDATAAAEFLNS
ncbi:DUF6087 family protein [Streptomyces sp. NPDC001389]|uniref:DUF6087 family protein n=1 Tax=Streptomyces sp. NPDC001389 TaxID=3364569 RepID=UPI0036B6F057